MRGIVPPPSTPSKESSLCAIVFVSLHPKKLPKTFRGLLLVTAVPNRHERCGKQHEQASHRECIHQTTGKKCLKAVFIRAQVAATHAKSQELLHACRILLARGREFAKELNDATPSMSSPVSNLAAHCVDVSSPRALNTILFRSLR